MTKKASPASLVTKAKPLLIKPLQMDVQIMRLPKKLSRRKCTVELPDDYAGCPDLGVIISVAESAAEYGFEPGQVVFFDMMLGREIATDTGVYVMVHKDDIIAQVDTDGYDKDWVQEAMRVQGIR
jgi:co-chaperonin GroES (HSP10)